MVSRGIVQRAVQPGLARKSETASPGQEGSTRGTEGRIDRVDPT